MDRPGLEIRSPLWRYGFAVLSVGVAVALTVSSERLGLAEPPVAAFLAAILLTGWYAGAGPVVLATLLSALVFDFFFVPPLHRMDIEHGRSGTNDGVDISAQRGHIPTMAQDDVNVGMDGRMGPVAGRECGGHSLGIPLQKFYHAQHQCSAEFHSRFDLSQRQHALGSERF